MYSPLIVEVVVTVLALLLVFTCDWLPRGLKVVLGVLAFVYVFIHMPHYLQIASKVVHGQPLYTYGAKSTLVDLIMR
jgi:heme/copper-type cytochrome/quinol oxidase subunit 4